MPSLHAVRSATHEMGLLNGLLYLVSRVLEVASAGRCRVIKYTFVAQPVPMDAPGRFSATRSVSLVSPADDIVSAFPRPAAVTAARFRRGEHCFAASRTGGFAGFLWLAEHAYPEDEVRCLYLLPSDAVWDYDVYVEPQHRMGRLFVQLWGAAHEFLRARGYRWSISRISSFNAASLAAHRRMGARPLASGVFVVLGQAQIALLSMPPFFHVSAGKRRPTLQFKSPD